MVTHHCTNKNYYLVWTNLISILIITILLVLQRQQNHQQHQHNVLQHQRQYHRHQQYDCDDDNNKHVELISAIHAVQSYGYIVICNKTSDRNSKSTSKCYDDTAYQRQQLTAAQQHDMDRDRTQKNIQEIESNQQRKRRQLREGTFNNSNVDIDNDTDNNYITINDNDDTNTEDDGGWMVVCTYILGVVICVVTAALAAGLTLGMLGLDPLMLLIKERAAVDTQERLMASKLFPIIKQRHLLLVSLLLMNSIANEAMPIFLERLVPPMVAVLLSVTLVLFFGEIIPSAIFTGPNQLKIAAQMVPLVQIVMTLLYPIAKPISSLLDWLLSNNDTNNNNNSGDNGDNNTSSSTRNLNSNSNENGGHHDESFNLYNRNELAALVRIHYEERLANKRKIKDERRLVTQPFGTPAATPTPKTAAELYYTSGGTMDRTSASIIHQTVRSYESNRSLQVLMSDNPTTTTTTTLVPSRQQPNQQDTQPHLNKQQSNNNDNKNNDNTKRQGNTISVSNDTNTNNSKHNNHHHQYWNSPHGYENISASIEHNRVLRESSIELDEVMMVEGALQMKTKVAFDVFTPIRHVYALPSSMVLNERNMVQIYASGYSRIPVYDDTDSSNKKRKYPQSAIIGILVTKVLIVVNPKDQRTVGSLPLRTPRCVSPGTPLVDLINMFQIGGARGGHQALVRFLCLFVLHCYCYVSVLLLSCYPSYAYRKSLFILFVRTCFAIKIFFLVPYFLVSPLPLTLSKSIQGLCTSICWQPSFGNSGTVFTGKSRFDWYYNV